MTTEKQDIQQQNIVCGACRNFKLKEGETLFNCVVAMHSGTKFGMQVRADSRACDAFVPK